MPPTFPPHETVRVFSALNTHSGCEKPSKDTLVDLILQAGLIQDFIDWLKSKGVELYGLKGLEDLDYNIILEFALEKRLVVFEDDIFESSDRVEEEYEPLDIKPKTPPKRR